MEEQIGSLRLQNLLIMKRLFAAAVLVGLLAFAFGDCLGQQDPKAGASPEWSIGDRGAPVVVEVFNDYQCRPCAGFNVELKRIQVKYAGRVRIVFRNFPITTTHENAMLAAQVAEAAGLQGKFFEMIDRLYLKQLTWAESKQAKKLFLSYARALKLNLTKFRTDLIGEEVRQRIRLDLERARSLNVPGTPTVVINGELIPHERLENLDAEIETKLNALKRASP
jgi:protein-disulfide isomerase